MNNLKNTELPVLLHSAWNQIDPIYRKALLIVFLINVLAFGQELVEITLIWDDYEQITWHKAGKWINQGRWFLDVIYFFFLGGWFAPFFHTLLGITVSTVTALLICNLWNLKRFPEVVLVAATISIYPLMADVYEWETNKVALPLANLLSVGAVWVTRRSNLSSILLGSIFILLSLATYQVAIHFAIETVLFITLINILIGPIDRGSLKLLLIKVLWPRLAMIGLGGIFYAISLKLISLFNIQLVTGRRYGGLISSWSNLLEKIEKQIYQLFGLVFKSHDVFPSLIAILISVLVLASIYRLLTMIFLTEKSISRRIVRSSLVFVIFGAALLSYQLIFLPSNEILIYRRAVSSFSIVIGALVALTLNFSRNILEKNAIYIVATALIFSFIIENNVEFTRRYFYNLHDWHLANRILARVESHPDFKKALPKRQMALIGFPNFLGNMSLEEQNGWKPYLEELSDLRGGILENIFSSLFESYNVVVEADWSSAPQAAVDYACVHASWPDPESVGILNDGLIVVVFDSKHVKSLCARLGKTKPMASVEKVEKNQAGTQ